MREKNSTNWTNTKNKLKNIKQILIMKTINRSMLAIGLLSFVFQSCTHDIYVDPQAAEKTAYENADAVNGSKLFSNFQNVEAGWTLNAAGWPAVTEAADPTIKIEDIATYTAQTGVTTPSPAPQANRLFYSCTGCHASDGMGIKEAGITKKASKTQPQFADVSLRGTRNWDNIKLFDAIKRVGGRQIDPLKTADGLNLTLGGQAHPDFSKILTDDKIWDLVKWLKEGVDNTNGDLYTAVATGSYAVPQTIPAPYVTYSNWGTDGDEAAGVSFYTAKCLVCHGADGNGTTNATGPVLAPGQVNGTTGAGSAAPGSATKKYGLGPYMRYKTADAVFLIQTGKFGTIPWMAATPIDQQQMKDLLKAFSNTSRFPDFAAARPNP